MKLTIFTPTYNRAYIIEKLYRSLQRQTATDFEWLVVDDGSQDNTAELFEKWQSEENAFPIRYYYKENGGKHRAINYGIQYASGEYFFIVDSDDYLANNSVERINYWLSRISGEDKFVGICGCCAYPSGEFIGTTFEGEFLDCTVLERGKYGIEGDKAEVFNTKILRMYPFPEYPDEKFITECVVWDRLAEDGYKLRFFNEAVYLAEYRDDGLTHQGMNLLYKNPQGYGYYLRMCRKNKKFKRTVSDYYDVECYKNWHSRMTLKQIAELIGTEPTVLLSKYIFYSVKEKGSRIKRKIVSTLKG